MLFIKTITGPLLQVTSVVIISGLIGDVIYKRRLQARYYRLHQWLSSQD